MDNDKMPEPVAWVERSQNGNTRMWSFDLSAWADRPVTHEPLYSAKTVQALQAECEEQARLNGMGAEREARLMAQVAELRAERDALANTDAGSALAMLSRMRFACGDNGLRMQDELEDYLRGLAKDAARYRWLRAGGLYRVGFDSTGAVSLSVLDSAIDAAMAEGEQ